MNNSLQGLPIPVGCFHLYVSRHYGKFEHECLQGKVAWRLEKQDTPTCEKILYPGSCAK